MKYINITALLLSILILFTACKVDTPPAEEPAADILFTGGENAYTIVRPESADENVIKSTTALYKALNKLDDRISMGTDRLRKDEKPSDREILIGYSNREEIATAETNVPYYGFHIQVVGKKLVILALDSDYYEEAIEYITGNLISEKGFTLKENFLYTQKPEGIVYPAKDASLGGRKLSEYAVWSDDKELGTKAVRILSKQSGHSLSLTSSESDEKPLIFLGKSAGDNPKRLSYYCYRIESDGTNIYITGYDEYALLQGVKKLTELSVASENANLELREKIYEYKLPDRRDYIKDPSLLYMRWEFERETPEWMLDFEAKKKNIFGGEGTSNLYASAHRAEWKYYPENSIESIISAYYLGAAIVELDISRTKDGVLILMHDGSLSRTTNCESFIGKAGFPKSASVSAWTYDQIKQLNLREGNGGENAKVTPFRIPTLEDALKVCKDRLFIIPDKADNWQYIDTENIMQSSQKTYLVDVMKKTGNFDSIVISYGKSSSNYLIESEAIELQKKMKAATGVAPMILIRATPDKAQTYYKNLSKDAEPGTFTLQINGDYTPSTKYETAYSSCGGKLPFLAWTIETVTKGNDVKKSWADMYSKGVRIIMTNDLFSLTEYCAEKGEN